jgi:DNA-binding NtrC family response regulator
MPLTLSKRLLFVDDEPNIRATLPAILRRYGLQAVATVAQALAEIQNREFDVLLCDLNVERKITGLTWCGLCARPTRTASWSF